MRSVSRLRSTPVRVLGVSASAAMTTARLVIDFEPGTLTVAATGRTAIGAVYGARGFVEITNRLSHAQVREKS